MSTPRTADSPSEPDGARALADHERRLAAPCPCHDRIAERPAWAQRRGPLRDLARRHGIDRDLLDAGWRPRWVDHDYRLAADGDHPERWVAEPYELGPDALTDLAHLDAHGWRVIVTAWQARHFPGHTLAVVIEPEDAA